MRGRYLDFESDHAFIVLLWRWNDLVRKRIHFFSLLGLEGQTGNFSYKSLKLHAVPLFYKAESYLVSHKAAWLWLYLYFAIYFVYLWQLIIVLEVDHLYNDIISLYFFPLMLCVDNLKLQMSNVSFSNDCLAWII